MSNNLINNCNNSGETENVSKIKIYQADPDYTGHRPHYQICDDGAIDYDIDFVLFKLDKRIKKDQLEEEQQNNSRNDEIYSENGLETDEIPNGQSDMLLDSVMKKPLLSFITHINSYIKQWRDNVKNWKFNKETHESVVRHMFDPNSVSDEIFSAVLKYLQYLKSIKTENDYLEFMKHLLGHVQKQINLLKLANENQGNNEVVVEENGPVERIHHILNLVDNFEIRKENRIITIEDLKTMLQSNNFSDFNFEFSQVDGNSSEPVLKNDVKKEKQLSSVQKKNVKDSTIYLTKWKNGSKDWKFSVKHHKFLIRKMYEINMITEEMFDIFTEYMINVNTIAMPGCKNEVLGCFRLFIRITKLISSHFNKRNCKIKRNIGEIKKRIQQNKDIAEHIKNHQPVRVVEYVTKETTNAPNPSPPSNIKEKKQPKSPAAADPTPSKAHTPVQATTTNNNKVSKRKRKKKQKSSSLFFVDTTPNATVTQENTLLPNCTTNIEPDSVPIPNEQ